MAFHPCIPWLAIHLREPDITVVLSEPDITVELSGIKVLYTILLGMHIIDHYDYFPGNVASSKTYTLVVINI